MGIDYKYRLKSHRIYWEGDMDISSEKLFGVILLSGFLPLICSPASAQGIGEYGGLMGMPRNIPTSHSQKTLNNLYGGAARNLNNAAPTAGGYSQSGGASASASAGSSSGANRADLLKLGQQAQIDLVKARKLAKEKKYDEAVALYKKSLAVRERFWAGRDKAVPEMYKELAEIYAGNKKFDEAEDALKSSIASYARLHGPGSKHTAEPLASLGNIYHAKGEHWKSHDSYLQSYMLTERYSGQNSKEAMELRLKMAAKSRDLKKFDKAADFYRKAIDIDSDNNILTAEEQADVLKQYAKVLRQLKRIKEAEKIEALLGGGAASAEVADSAENAQTKGNTAE